MMRVESGEPADDEDKYTAVTLTIGKDEAIILYELLVDYFDEPALSGKDDADRMALTRLAGTLEKTLVEPFMPEWNSLKAQARERLIAASGSHKIPEIDELLAWLRTHFGAEIVTVDHWEADREAIGV